MIQDHQIAQSQSSADIQSSHSPHTACGSMSDQPGQLVSCVLPLCTTGRPLLQSGRQRADTQPTVLVSQSEANSAAIAQSRRMRRQTDAKVQNPCLENLMNTMIEYGVQCNVQSSAPSTPTMLVRPPLSRTPSGIDLNAVADSGALDPLMSLEVDSNDSDQDGESWLHETLTLRKASAPAGIRKFGTLRFRTSAEAAQQCSNLKKNETRMRRRPKAKTRNPAHGASPSDVSIKSH
jgi:hypothetical protein